MSDGDEEDNDNVDEEMAADSDALSDSEPGEGSGDDEEEEEEEEEYEEVGNTRWEMGIFRNCVKKFSLVAMFSETEEFVYLKKMVYCIMSMFFLYSLKN